MMPPNGESSDSDSEFGRGLGAIKVTKAAHAAIRLAVKPYQIGFLIQKGVLHAVRKLERAVRETYSWIENLRNDPSGKQKAQI